MKQEKSKSKFGRTFKLSIVLSVISLFAVMGIVQSWNEKKIVLARERHLIKEQLERVSYFKKNRESILLGIQDDIAKKNYVKAVSVSGKYLSVNDVVLTELHDKAVFKSELIKKNLKTDRILSRLKKIPVKEYKKNMNLYKKLLEMHPDSVRFSKKYTYYFNKVKEKDLAEK